MEFNPAYLVPIDQQQAADNLVQGRQDNLYRNRLMAMQLKQMGDSAMANESYQNYLVRNRDNGAVPFQSSNPSVSSDGGIVNALAAPTVNVERYEKPRDIGEFKALNELRAFDQQKQIYQDQQSGELLKRQLTQLQMAAEQGKIKEQNQKLIQSQLDTAIRAMAPVEMAYEAEMQKEGMTPMQAIQNVRPLYQHTIGLLKGVKGLENVGQLLPQEYNPGISYMAKDTYAALEKIEAARVKAADTRKEFSDPYTIKIGGKPVSVQRNLKTGEIKRIAEDKSSTVVVSGNAPTPEAKFKNWTKDEKEFWFQAAKTGNMPKFGFGDRESYSLFNKEFAKWSKSGGLSGTEFGAAKEDFKSSAAALRNDEKQYDLMKRSEKQAGYTANLLRKSSLAYNRGNVRFINNFQALAKNALNDPKLATFQMNLLAFSREYYKVVTNSYASASELSVGAQQQADKMLNTSDSWASLDAKIKAAEQEMRGTSKTFKSTIDDRRKQMRTGDISNTPKPSLSEIFK